MTEPGSTNESQSSGSSVSSQGSPDSSSAPPGRVGNRSMDVLCWVTVGIVTYGWLVAKALPAGTPGIAILGFYASAILPGSVLMGLGTVLIDRVVPARGGGK